MDKWLSLVSSIAPLILRLIHGGDKLAGLTPLIIHGITEAEQIKGATGAEKKAHVEQIVADGIAVTNTVAGKTILDPAVTVATTSAGIDAVVGAVNLVHAVKTAADAPSVAPAKS